MLNLGESKIYSPYNVYLNQVANDHFKYGKFHDGLRDLPENLQDFIFDTVPGDFVKDRLAIPFGLSENQSQETAKIIMELVISELYLGNIVNEIRSHLSIDEQKAKTIAGLIVTELFAPILEELKKIHVEKFAKNLPKTNPQIDDRIVNLKNNL